MVITGALLGMTAPSRADVALADLFTELAVLQRGVPVPVWGTADPGETVKVTFEGKSAEATADAQGRWRVTLGPFEAAAARPLVVEGKNRIVRERVFVGDVWICSGQSNMWWPLKQTEGGDAAIREGGDPRLLLYTVARRVAEEPRPDAGGGWQRADALTLPTFSAVAYWFGRRLREETGVPIGLIHSSWGGTPAEAWTRTAALRADPATRPILERWDQALAAYPERERAFQRALQEFKEGKTKQRPRPPPGPDSPHRPSGLYRGMIAPLVPYGVRGVIWYQGESNAGRAEQYATLFPMLIRDWRDAWGREDLPFYFVQLANFHARKEEPAESAWAELREAQRLALALPRTGMAVTIDIGDANDIHPRNKRDVGARLARLALADLYEKEIVRCGPLYESHAIDGASVTIRFRSADGLAAKDGAALTGFTIAGADRKFVRADAKVVDGTVVVSHESVKEPKAVRYAWADNPACNLVNGAGLPASPFRTDDWPWSTAGRR